MMDINPSDLRYFFEVAQSLNISRAAERLDVGQPTVSQAIQRIERLIGVSVIDRFKTGVQLTVAGRKLLNEGRAALEAWDRMKLAAQSAGTSIEGRYTIGCHSAVGLYILPKFLKPLLEKYVDLEISLKHALSREIVADVIGFKIDFGIAMNPIRHPDLIIRPIYEDRVSLWRVKNAIEDTLIFDPALSQAQTLIKKIENSLKIRKHLTSGSLEVIATLAAAGAGIGVLPARIAALNSSLYLASNDGPWVRDRLALVYRADRSLTAAAKLIIDSIMRSKF